jgi:DNA polymerase-1
VWFIVPSASKDASGDEGGTIQARITCKRPSAQTFPPEIKQCIQSRWVGGRIISMDLSQIELRMAALCSGDPSLLAAFNTGLDLHTHRAVQLFGQDSVTRPTFKKRERQVGKTMNFADLFLASPQRMRMSVHEMTGELMPLSFFEEVARSRPDARPGLHRWQQSLISRVATDGYLLLPILGQSRTFVGGPAAHLNEVVNFPIQTQASNTLIQIQSRLLEYLPKLYTQGPRPLMFLQVYDAIYFDVPPQYEDSLKAAVQQAVLDVASPSGYWGRLQEYYGNQVPLEYEID